jgi:hypothetical protein
MEICLPSELLEGLKLAMELAAEPKIPRRALKDCLQALFELALIIDAEAHEDADVDVMTTQ